MREHHETHNEPHCPLLFETDYSSCHSRRCRRGNRHDAAHGQVDGQFTLMGKTRPVTFDVSLVGAGKGFAGGPVMGHVIGIHAETSINPPDYGLPAIFFSDPITLTIDTEFDHVP